MSIQLYINGVDKSSAVLWESLAWNQAINNEVDTISFSIQKFGSRTFAPASNDTVLLYDNAVKVFGGTIVSRDREYSGYDNTIYTVVAKDFSHDMDRRLVAEKYNTVPAINIICDILNKYVNKILRVDMANFELSEVWSGGTADTTNFRTETQGRKLTSVNNVMDSMTRTIYLDLTQNSLGNSDYIDIDVYVDFFSNLSIATLKLGDITLTNYFSKNITSQITQNGWNQIHILRSDFSSTGSPSFAAINFIKIEVTSVAATTVNATFDNLQTLSANAYTRNNANDASQIVKYLPFNYEYPSKCISQIAELFQWNWYVDQDRDIHLFPQYGELSPFDLTDTNGKYVYRSLMLNDNVDQLRNSIFVRGGEYLDASVTDDLGHQVDGLNKIFKVGYKYSLETVTLTLNSVEKAIGQDNVEQYADNQGVSQLQKGTTFLNVGDASGNTKQSIEIIAAKKGRRTKFKVRLKKTGTPVDNFQLQVFADDGNNKPSATALSTVVTLAGGSIASASATEYTFTLTESSTNTLLISKNTKFHVVATRSGGNDGSNYYQIDVFNKVYDGFSYAGTAVPAWTATAYSWYFIEVLGYDALYNIDQKIITFFTAPPNGQTLTIAAQPYKAVFIQQKDNVSIAAYGEFQFKIVDSTILTKEGGRQRAIQEILAWAAEVTEAEFMTYEPGLRVGQTINIQSDVRGLDTDYIINSVDAKTRSGTAFEYSISLVTTKTLGILYFLQQQLLNDDKNAQIDDTEVLDRLEGFDESITFTETSVTSTLFTGKVWSNDAGTTPDKLIWDGGAAHIFI